MKHTRLHGVTHCSMRLHPRECSIKVPTCVTVAQQSNHASAHIMHCRGFRERLRFIVHEHVAWWHGAARTYGWLQCSCCTSAGDTHGSQHTAAEGNRLLLEEQAAWHHSQACTRVCPHTEPTAACIGVQSTHLLLRVADVEDGTEARPLLLKREGKEQEDRERGRAGYMD